MSKKLAGTLSMLGTLAVAWLIGAAYGDASGLWNDVVLFVTGRGAEIGRVRGTPPSDLISGGLYLAALSMTAAIVAAVIASFFVGAAKSREILFEHRERKDLKIFKTLFVVVLLEEIFARWLFLGLLRQVPALSGPVGLYVLFFLGNGIWSLLHLGNYIMQYDRHPIRVLPQFVGGVIMTVAYLKWGLFGSLLVHFTHNAIAFASSKRESVGAGWFIHVASTVTVLIIASLGFERSWSELAPWISGGRLEPLAGWTYGDYVWMMVGVNAVVSLACLFLLYDQPRLKDGSVLERLGFGKVIVVMFFSIVVTAVAAPLLSYLSYWFVGLFVDDMTVQIAGACLLTALFGKTDSLSRAMRSYWSLLTNSFLFLCVVATLGVGPAIQISFLASLILIPFGYLELRYPAGDQHEPEDLAQAFARHLFGRRRSP